MKHSTAPQWKDSGAYKEVVDADNVRVVRLEVDNATTYIDSDSDTNLILVDAVTGSKKLSELSGSGDVDGPATAVDNAIVRFDGTTGKIIQDYTSGAPTIGNTGAVTITTGLTTNLVALGDNQTIRFGPSVDWSIGYNIVDTDARILEFNSNYSGDPGDNANIVLLLDHLAAGTDLGLFNTFADDDEHRYWAVLDKDRDSYVMLGFAADDDAQIVIGGSTTLTMPGFVAGGAITGHPQAITDNALVTVDDASVAANELAVWTASGVGGTLLAQASIIVAADDSTASEKAAALASGGTVCDGTADESDIITALAAITQGWVYCCPGNYSFTDKVTIPALKGVVFGIGNTIVPAANDDDLFWVDPGGSLVGPYIDLTPRAGGWTANAITIRPEAEGGTVYYRTSGRMILRDWTINNATYKTGTGILLKAGNVRDESEFICHITIGNYQVTGLENGVLIYGLLTTASNAWINGCHFVSGRYVGCTYGHYVWAEDSGDWVEGVEGGTYANCDANVMIDGSIEASTGAYGVYHRRGGHDSTYQFRIGDWSLSGNEAFKIVSGDGNFADIDCQGRDLVANSEISFSGSSKNGCFLHGIYTAQPDYYWDGGITTNKLTLTTQAITDNSLLTVDGTIASADMLRATANGAEGRTYAELMTDLPAATTTAPGKSELAIASEINTGTDATRANSPDALAGSNFGVRYMQGVCYDFTTDNAVADGVMYFHVPPALDGMNLIYVHAEVITAGTTGTEDIQIHNLVTGPADMLSTVLTIDTGETGSDTAATPYVINGAADHVATNDVIRVDVDVIHTTAAKGLIVTLGFQLP